VVETNVTYDLLVRGGHVVDPGQSINDELDIAVLGERIAAIGKSIPDVRSQQVVDATGSLVLPGLVDLHCHVYDGVSKVSVPPDEAGVEQGVTTVVDGGSAGHAIFGGFPKYVVPAARTRVFCFLNLASQGFSVVPEFVEWADIDPSALRATITSHHSLVKGVKLRLTGPLVEASGRKVVEAAKEIAKDFALPVMVHLGDDTNKVPATLTQEVLDLLDEGDILTHVFTAKHGTIVGDDGFPVPQARDAMERGVVFDVAVGRSNLSANVARKCVDQGILPTTISTDLTAMTIGGPVYGMAVTMSKFMALGFSLEEVTAMATVNPARVLNGEQAFGILRAGMYADISVLELRRGLWELNVSDTETLRTNTLLVPRLTIRAGQVITPRLESYPLEAV
jgi:dihydroorotase